jgi:hypothetical protein
LRLNRSKQIETALLADPESKDHHIEPFDSGLPRRELPPGRRCGLQSGLLEIADDRRSLGRVVVDNEYAGCAIDRHVRTPCARFAPAICDPLVKKSSTVTPNGRVKVKARQNKPDQALISCRHPHFKTEIHRMRNNYIVCDAPWRLKIHAEQRGLERQRVDAAI